MRDDETIPDLNTESEKWEAWAKQLSAALEPVFDDDREILLPRHLGFSFLRAIYLALDGKTLPLARFIRDARGRRMLTEEQWQFLAVFIQSLGKPPKPLRGRPPALATSPVVTAEAFAARLVTRWQAQWRKDHHGKRRVPDSETKKMIDKAIKQAAASFEVPEDKIKESNIRNLQKSGRAVRTQKR